MSPAMKYIIASFLVFFLFSSVRAADAVPVEVLALKKSAAIVWEGRSHETIV